jgi:glycopeptide antibiotics resistance protein
MDALSEPTNEYLRMAQRTIAFTQPQRKLVVALFVVYLLLLVWVILWKLTPPSVGIAAFTSRPLKLIPFVPSTGDGASVPLEVLANILLFVPFGVYLRSLAPAWRVWMLAAIFLGSSLILEITQHVVAIGSFDSTDLIANTAGGLVGIGLLALARRRFQSRANVIVARLLLIFMALAIVAATIFIASPLRYVQQPDVIFPLDETATPGAN